MLDATTTDAGGLPLERVEQELRELATHLDAAACRFLLLLADFDRRGGWADWGCRSAAQWLSWRCGIGLVAGRQKVKVAHALSELPLVAEAFSKGEISYSKVRAIVRVVKHESEATLLEWARTGTAEHVERICRARRRVDLAEANDIHARRSLTWRWDEDGSFVLRGRLSAEDGALVQAAIDAFLDGSAESLGRGDAASESSEPRDSAESPEPRDSAESPAEPEPLPARRADALVHMAELILAGGTEGAPGGEHTQVVVHVDAETLVGHDDDGECSLEDGPAIAPETARRLACSAEVFTMVEDAKGQVLSLGRTRRTFNRAQRRALGKRHEGCGFPGCDATALLHGHHAQHWIKDGETNIANGVLLCRTHHRLVHEGGWSISLTQQGQVEVRRPDGTLLTEPPAPSGSAETLAGQHRELGIDAETSVPLWAGEVLDLDLAIDVLLHQEGEGR